MCVIFLFGYFYLFFAIVEIKDFFFHFADQGITLGRDFSGVIVDVGMTASNEYKIGTYDFFLGK